jgi:hypothetical protein
MENQQKIEKTTETKKEQILVSAAVAARTLLMDSQGKEDRPVAVTKR